MPSWNKQLIHHRRDRTRPLAAHFLTELGGNWRWQSNVAPHLLEGTVGFKRHTPHPRATLKRRWMHEAGFPLDASQAKSDYPRLSDMHRKGERTAVWFHNSWWRGWVSLAGPPSLPGRTEGGLMRSKSLVRRTERGSGSAEWRDFIRHGDQLPYGHYARGTAVPHHVTDMQWA